MNKYLITALIAFLCIGFLVGRYTAQTGSNAEPLENMPLNTEHSTPSETSTEDTTNASDTVSYIVSTTTSSSTPTPTVATNTPSVSTKPEKVVTETSKPSGFKTMAWIYPSAPGCNAQSEYRDGRKIQVLKPEFFTVNGGSLIAYDTDNSECNGYSAAFVADLKKYSNEQFVTVSSASAGDMDTFLASALGDGDEIETLVSFVVDNNLTGIELDFEDFGGWSKTSYSNFRLFVEKLGSELHTHNKKLMLDGPAIANQVEQGWFAWRYEDFITLPVDYIVIMAYDYQFDHGAGVPVAPLDWMREVITWISTRYPKDRLVVGVPSYGYEGTIGRQPYIRTYDQLKSKSGFSTAERDESSGEMTWQSGKQVYFYQDSESIRQKISVVKELGISSISIWHLGGNQWY